MSGSGNIWAIDAQHTSVGFSVRFLEISNVKGGFSTVGGSLEYDSREPLKFKLDAFVGADSISTHNEMRDRHLKEEAMFFDVEKFRLVEFRSSSAEAAGVGKLKVTGDLTLHGVTREAVFDVEGPTQEVADPLTGKIKMAAFARARINRNDFGMTMPLLMEAGTYLIGDEVDISIDAVFERENRRAMRIRPE